MKKTIKVLLSILLVASMVPVLTGCGDKENSKKGEDAVEQSKDVNVQQEEKVEISMGKWNGNVYTNDFLGLKFNLPEGWKYSSDEEIAEMMNLGADLLNDEQKASAELAKLTSVTYVAANNPNTGNNVTIMSEKLLMDLTTEYYINQLKTQLAAVESMKYTIGGTATEKVGSLEYDTLTVSVDAYGITQKYYIRKMDNYIACIILTSVNGETGINEMVNCFQ